MNLQVTSSGQACGAAVTGIDLSQPLDAATIAAIRTAWLEHHVLAFPDQNLSDDDLERFTLYFGEFGDNAYIAPIPGRRHIMAIERSPHEKASLFADSWHTDWSFYTHPPWGTCTYGIAIPPVGGDTIFANQHAALDAMPDALRVRIEGRVAIHSGRIAFLPDGAYGSKDKKDRSIRMRPSKEAVNTQRHPLIRKHAETRREALFGCLGYIIGIEGMDDAEAMPLLAELREWQTRPSFLYRHRWQPKMLVMWDNRSLLHLATGGYAGHHRLLHRTSIAAASDDAGQVLPAPVITVNDELPSAASSTNHVGGLGHAIRYLFKRSR